MRRAIGLTLGLMLLTPVACTNNTTQPTATVATIQVAPASIHLALSDSVQLTASPLDGDGHLISGIAMTFTSLDTAIATVSATGLVHARGVGTTSVKVSGGGVNQSVPATVFAVPANPASITVTPGDTTISQDGTYTLHATVYDNTHAPIPGATVAFASQDSTIATVTSGGVVTGKKGGATTLFVTSGPAGGAATVTVLDTSIASRTPLNGLPFGAAATKSGTAYVLRHALNSASRFNLPSSAAVLSFGVHDNPTFVTFDSSGATAYVTAQFANLVDVVTVASNTVTSTINVTGNPVIVRVSPDDKSMWVSTNVDSLYQIDRGTKAVLARYGLPLVPNGLAFSPTNDSLLYVSTLDVGEVVEINYKRETTGRTFLTGGKTQAVAISPDGAELYVANEAFNEVEIFDLASGSQLTSIPTTGGAFDLTLSPDGSAIWVSESNVGVVQAFNRTTRQVQRTVNTGGAPRRIAVTPATTTVLVANEYGWVDFIK
jgi:DNA-binding beta-propeller fold protein YncE